MISVAPIQPHELLPAARLMAAAAPASEREARAVRFADLVRAGEIDAGGLLLARRSGEPVGVAVVQLMPGGSAVVVPPAPDGGPATDALAATAVQFLRGSRAVIAHVFLDTTDAHKAAPLLRHGFFRAATIAHLLRDLAHLPPPPPLTFTRSTADPALFGETLLATYAQSLDVPEASTDRPANDVLAGYADGQPDPPYWWLARDPNGAAVGVLILVPPRFTPTWELGYLGVVPAARGQGYGAMILRFALRAAAELGAAYLTLSVDTRNEPALAVYRGHGFRAYHRQRVFLWRRDTVAKQRFPMS
ncbi:MAG: GNAT family N-acetyltransferase [Fimbriiglobus sp.]|nr:GNAT family N-acetyltransferase [Fimbriiglobus sp.]